MEDSVDLQTQGDDVCPQWNRFPIALVFEYQGAPAFCIRKPTRRWRSVNATYSGTWSLRYMRGKARTVSKPAVKDIKADSFTYRICSWDRDFFNSQWWTKLSSSWSNSYYKHVVIRQRLVTVDESNTNRTSNSVLERKFAHIIKLFFQCPCRPLKLCKREPRRNIAHCKHFECQCGCLQTEERALHTPWD